MQDNSPTPVNINQTRAARLGLNDAQALWAQLPQRYLSNNKSTSLWCNQVKCFFHSELRVQIHLQTEVSFSQTNIVPTLITSLFSASRHSCVLCLFCQRNSQENASNISCDQKALPEGNINYCRHKRMTWPVYAHTLSDVF